MVSNLDLVRKLLIDLSQANITIYLEGEKLKTKAPKGAITSVLAGRIKICKQALIDFLHEKKHRVANANGSMPVCMKVDRDRITFALSSAQHRLWFIEQLNPGDTQYNIPMVLCVDGSFDLVRARKALIKIIERHEILRTVYRLNDYVPVQVVNREFAFRIVEHDLRSLPESAREREITALVKLDRQGRFDLENDLMLRASYIHCTDRAGILLFSMHHIASDGWSMGILIQEFAHLYNERASKSNTPLPVLDVQYVDFANGQQQWLASSQKQQQLDYWLEHLSALPDVHSLPLDRPRSARQSFGGAIRRFKVGLGKLHKLKQLGASQDATLFMVLHSALTVLLARYANSEDIVLGTPVANRNQQEIQGLIGYFANTLVLRTKVEPRASFLTYLDHVRQVNLAAQNNQHIPFDELVERLNPPRNPALTPLFQIMFSMNNNDVPDVKIEGVSFESWLGEEVSAKFDLTFETLEHDQGLTFSIEYNTELFDSSTIEKLAHRFDDLIDQIVVSPQRSIQDLLVASEQTQQAELWEQQVALQTHAATCGFVEAFEQQVMRTPKAVALSVGTCALSYDDLNRKSNRLAHYLKAQGVEQGDLVGLCFTNCAEMMLGLLAVLKAGAAYVPISPHYPAQRLNHIVEDTNLKLLLTLAETKPTFQHLPDVNVVALDSPDLCFALQVYSEEDLGPQTSSSVSHLAYVIYTSGSTGYPKGVKVTHKALAGHLWAVISHLNIHADDKVLQCNHYCFDAFVELSFAALITGAQLTLAPDNLLDGVTFFEQAEALGVTISDIPAAYFAHLISSTSDSRKKTTLTRIVIGGESTSTSTVRQWLALKRFDECRLFNAYGPTEAVITTTYRIIDHRDIEQVRIGKPVSGKRLVILDDRRHPVPYGAVGELYVGGELLAEGYLNLPDATEESFVVSPFPEKTGARLYRTGDLVRYLPDGELQFIGRRDGQVQIRGFRIETNEVENQLLRLADIRACAVIAVDVHPQQKQLVAYIVAENHSIDAAELVARIRVSLGDTLPSHMIPAHFVQLDVLPVDHKGQTDKAKLSVFEAASVIRSQFVAPKDDLEKSICAIWQEVLQQAHIGVNDNFFEVGGNSLLSVTLHQKLATLSDVDVSLMDLFEHPTVAALAAFIRNRRVYSDTHFTDPSTSQPAIDRDIAVIGMSGRFPDAKNVDQFWENIQNGKESVIKFTDEELRVDGVSQALLDNPNYVKSGIRLDDIESFDAGYFGFTPREAEIMDPQQRLLLECAVEALEDAGYANRRQDTDIGVFVGVGDSHYLLNNLMNSQGQVDHGFMQTMIANSKDYAATRLSYKLNLQGPSISVNTACSTSLVAVHQAINSLLLGECAMALAGAAAVSGSKATGYLYEEGGVQSADGHCRAFDKDATGTYRGDGVGLLLLKRLDHALRDGDHVHAVIKGSAINNDGLDKVGFTAPSIAAQAKVIRAAQINAKVDPVSIQYLEAHGTGTKLGDPIEITAATRAFGSSDKQFCAVGSVKTNIGHLDTAAGMAGLIKTIQALKHQKLPPSLHYESSNPAIDFNNSPFYVNTQLRAWPKHDHPRRAGVSAFGFGGTNAHVILEEAPLREIGEETDTPSLLVVSGKTETDMRTSMQNLALHLQHNRDLPLQDVAYTLQVGRNLHEHRKALVCTDVNDAVKKLLAASEHLSSETSTAKHEAVASPVIFMFPGQGAQHVNMARRLYEQFSIFRLHVDRCADLLLAHFDFDIRDIVYQDSQQPTGQQTAKSQLQNTQVTQPLLFTIEYSLAQLLLAWNIQPTAMIGHSLGEYVAACISGVFSLEDALRLVATRAKMMQQLAPGCMLSVHLSEEDVIPMLGQYGGSLAAVNGPKQCVVAGSASSLNSMIQALSARDIPYKQLDVSHAFHSSMMDPILVRFESVLKSITFYAPKLPYISNLNGMFIDPLAVQEPAYWVNHLRQTVRFAAGIDTLNKHFSNTGEAGVFLELGPGTTLSSLVRKNRKGVPNLALSCCNGAEKWETDLTTLYVSLGKLWAKGAMVNWQRVNEDRMVKRVPLPTYPFHRKRFWVDKTTEERPPLAGAQPQPNQLGHALYEPYWKISAPSKEAFFDDNTADCWLVLGSHDGLGKTLVELLESKKQNAVLVCASENFKRINERHFTLSPGQSEHYGQLFEALDSEIESLHVIHLFGVAESRPVSTLDLREDWYSQEATCLSVLHIIQSYLKSPSIRRLDIDVMSVNTCRITGVEDINPLGATVSGLCRVVPQEYHDIGMRQIDLEQSPGMTPDAWQQDATALLLNEICVVPAPAIVAYRSGHRFVRDFAPVTEKHSASARWQIRDGGVYMITGGTGNIGLSLAHWLAGQAQQIKLVLLTRTDFPEQSRWSQTLEEPEVASSIKEQITCLQAIKKRGADVQIIKADVTNFARMAQVLASLEADGQLVNGIVHCAGDIHSSIKGVYETRTEDFEVQYQAKVSGVAVLDKLFQARPLDFCILMSSISTVLGGLGFSAYAAANAYMDAFAQAKHNQGDHRWLSINWDGWNFDTENPHRPFRNSYSVSAEQGCDAFAKALCVGNVPQLIVAVGDFQERIDKWLHGNHQSRSRASLYARPELDSDFVPPTNLVEKLLVDQWQALLGIEQIGIHDNFFELGGDSLLLTRALVMLKEEFTLSESQIPIKQFFDYPTIADLATIITNSLNAQKASEAKSLLAREGKEIDEGFF